MTSDPTTQAAPPRLYFSVAPEPSHLLRARDRIRDYLRQYCAEPRVIDDVVLCVEEAATNAIRHSGSERDIEISLRFADGDLLAEVKDHGQAFDLATFDREALPDVMSDHGRGLFIVAKLMDSLELSLDGGLEVRMVRHAEPHCEPTALETGVGYRDARARATLEEIDEGFIALDWEYRYVHANRVTLGLTGKSFEELLGHTPWEVFPDLKAAPLREHFRQAMELGKPSVSEHRSLFTDTWSEVRVYPTVTGLSAYFNDVTERKRAEEERQTVEARYRTIVETSTEGIVIGSPEGVFTFANQRVAEMLGYRVDELVGMSGSDLAFPGWEPQQSEARAELHNGQVVRREIKLRRKDGSALWSRYSATPIFDAQGAHVANLVMHSDFTAAKAADEALRESEDKYRTMVETSAEGVVVAGPDGAYTYVNQRMADMLGYRPDELLGKSANDLTCDRGLLAQVLNARDGLARGDAVHGEIEFRRRDGSSLWTMYSISPLHDASGAHIGNLAMHTDITGRKRAEEDRQRLLEDSQAQGEELQAQAEELQTQAEEMQIQGEELRAQSEELFTQRDELLRESELRAGLNALTLLLHSTLKPDEVMRRALVEATRVLAIDAAAIALPEGGTWPVRFAAGLPPEALGSPLTGEPAISRLLAHSGEVLVLDQVTDHETVDPFATRLGVRSLMAVPLIAQEQVIGTLLLVERRTTRHFTEAEIDFARRLGTSVSLALENARLFEAEREAQRNAGEELQATTRLLEAARALADWRDLGEVVRALAQTLLHSTAHTRAMVSLWDEGRGEFELIAAEGLRPMPLGSRWAMDVSSTAAVKAVTQRSAQVWDLDALPEAKRGQQWADYQPHLALHVPLVGREKVVGLLSLDDPGERREFGEREIKLVEGIAANATVAIENARLFSDVLEASGHLGNVLQSMADGFVSVDHEWRYTLVNPQAERLIGRSAGELLGQSMEELFPDMEGWPHYRRAMSETYGRDVRGLVKSRSRPGLKFMPTRRLTACRSSSATSRPARPPPRSCACTTRTSLSAPTLPTPSMPSTACFMPPSISTRSCRAPSTKAPRRSAPAPAWSRCGSSRSGSCATSMAWPRPTWAVV